MFRLMINDVSPEQAAVGQLETAIELWFDEKDAASIHTLAAAAHGMFVTIARDRKIELGGTKRTDAFIKTKPKWFQDYLRDPQNYFKHGNPKLKLGYHPRHHEVMVMRAISACSDLKKKLSPKMVAFVGYHAIAVGKVDELLTNEMQTVLAKAGSIDELAVLNRQSFFEKVLPLLANHRRR